ncbi:MAG TPA: carboxypeptidase-like regulatory domain-containing protein [Thermoanaerobaculia bacterium]|nr:carboxypeptidase-like regulatory domain-containing protein [Thermoanaerobaculia bacterium]
MNPHFKLRPARPLAALCLIALVAAPLMAQRTRPVRRGVAPSPATLNGRVLDAETGAPVFEAVVTAGDEMYVADAEGRFQVTTLPPGNVTIHIARWGYEPKEETFLLRFGDNEMEFRLNPLPAATARMDDGTSYLLDLESLRFGNFFAFSGWNSSVTLQLCLPNGQVRGVDRAEMRNATFGETRQENTSCCSLSPGVIVTIELADGSVVEGTSRGSCSGYDMYLLARNRGNGEFEQLRLLELDRVEFP